MTTTATVSLSAGQTEALLQGLTVLTQRLDELSTSQAFTTEMVGLSQPMATMQQIGQVLADGLSQPVGDLVVSGAKTVAEIKTLIQSAVAAVGDVNLSAITESIETLADREILWLDLALSASTTLVDYSLSLGQSPSSDAGAPSLLDQGLKTGDIAIDVEAGLHGNIRIGVDLRPGLAADQSIVFKVDNLEACATASGVVEDVTLSYGILDLGALDAQVDLEACVLIDLVEGSLGHLTLGDLNAGSASSLFNLSWPGASDSTADLSIDFDFELDIDGFQQSGQVLTLGIEALNGFDLGTLELVLPEIQIDGASVDFDFSQFAQFSLDDLGNYLTGLRHWLPQLGDGFELPVLGRDLGDLFDLGAGLGDLFDGLQDDSGNWTFDGIHGMLSQLATGLGIPEAEIAATFALNWSDAADALEWTLPWSHEYSNSVDFDANSIVPSTEAFTLPLQMAARAQAAVEANLDFSITGGIALTSSAGMVALTGSSLLSSLNSGVGLRSNGLISGDDLHFTLADGSTLGRDLNNIAGLGVDGSAGTATIADLLAVLNVAGKLQATLEDNRLVIKDLTSGSGTFSVTAPSVTVTIGTGGSGVTTTSTSVAPLVLGLWGASAELVGTAQVITGASLESISPQDRIYIREQAASDPLISGSVTIDGLVEGGAALGPMSLKVVEGQVYGSAQWDLLLIDPATGADDGRIYLAELAEADLADVIDHNFTSPSLDGVFQLAVTPDALNTALNIDPADYSSDPLNRSSTDLDVKPNTVKVPYIELNLETAGGWDFSLEPSEKLKSLFSAGWDELSWQDLPDLLDMLILELEDTDLWALPIPMTELTLGDLLGFRDLLVEFSLPDLNVLLGDLSGTVAGSAGIGDFKLDFDAKFGLALGELQNLDASLPALDLSGRFDQLQWTLSDLLLAWQGRDAGDMDFEANFLVRLGAWKSNLSLTLGDLDVAIAAEFPSTGSLPVPGTLSDLKSSLQGLLAFIDTIPFGLDGFATVLEGLFMDGATPRIPGLSLNVDLPTVEMSGTNQRVLFDLEFTLDSSKFTHTLELDALDLSGSPLMVDGAGKITATLGGALNTQIGFDFGTGQPIFEPADTSANLTLGIATAANTTLGASLGGLVGLSVGRVDGSVTDPIVITLTESSSSTSPAVVKFNDGVSGLSGSAYLNAHLPLYVTSVAGTAPIVTVDLTGSLDLSPPLTGTLTPTITGNISNLFSQGDLGLSGWINGAILFIDALTAVLESDLVGSLPFVEGIDLSNDGFLADLRGVLVTLQTTAATTLGQVQTTLNTALGNVSLSLDGTANFVINGSAAATPAQLALTMEELFAVNFDADASNDISSFVVDLGLSGLFEETIDFGELDLGFGPVELGGTGGLDLAASFGLNLGLGYSPSQGFFVQGTSAAGGKELTVDLGLGMGNPSGIDLDLGPLKFAVADGTTGDVVTNAASRELSATLNLDLGTGKLAGAGADLLDNMSVTGEVIAKLDLELTSNVGLGMGLTTGFYEADGSAIELSWTPADGLEWSDGALNDYLHFDMSGVYIDFDTLFGDAISEMASRLAQAFEPMAPVLDMLTDEVPLISDLSKKLGQGSVTYLDAIGWFGEGLNSATEFIETLNTLVEMNGELARTGRFYLGSLGLGSSSASSAMSASSASSSAASSPSLTYTEDSGGQSDAVSSGDRNSLFDNKWGLDFPILEEPATELFDLLVGGQADLITWNIPDLDAGFELRKSFPIFPPLFVELFGGVNFKTNFDMGYDTRGIKLAMDSGDAGDLLKGVYLHDDHSGVTGASNDPELSLSATIGAGAKLDVVVAKAGVEGGLKGTLAADLADPDNNGKVYVDELVDQLSNGVECVFDLSGSLEVFLSAYIKVGIDTPFGFVTLYKDRFKLAEATILDWSAHLCEPTVPDVASASGSTLTLHMGSDASKVIPGKTEDGDEVFLVEYADGKTLVTAYGHTEAFTGINKIVFNAGAGNDTVLIDPSVTVAVDGQGGDGNDNLVGGSGTNWLRGDAGSDVLSGRASGDSLDGGADDDFLYGYGGADTLDGGDGDDAIYGEDDIGDMVEFKAKNADFKAGTAGADSIIGGIGDDLIVAGDGNDTVLGGLDDDAIDAGAGNDSVEAGDGNDQVFGGTGDDKLYGDNKNGSTVFGTSHDDKIEGGEGYNEIWGGAGDDLLYAADEDQLASASGSTVGTYSSRIEGGDGADMMYGTAGKDWLAGGFESDYIDSGAGNDFLLGGPGGDALLASGGNATLLGGHGNDVIDGGDGANWIEGGPGDDQIFARVGADTVYGGTTNETLKGGYKYLQEDLAGTRAVDEAEHGGFRATPAADSCGPEIFFYPEVYAPTAALSVNIFGDTDRDGQRDAAESGVLANSQWQVTLVQASDGALVWEGAVTGNQLVREVPDGIYEVIVNTGTDNRYLPSTSSSISLITEMVAGVQKVAGAAATAQMGWYTSSDITGRVSTYNSSTKAEAPAPGAVVFIDADKDGSWDSSETYTTTAADGSYALRGLAAGSYTLGVTDDGVCALPAPRSATVTLDGVNNTLQNFSLTLNTAPVVSEVLLYGGPTTGSRWWSVPDGNEQTHPINPSGVISKIAIDLCSTVGVQDKEVSAQLLYIDTGRKINLSGSSTSVNHVEFNLQEWLQFGKYQLTVQAASLTDQAGTALDGEWKYPQGYDSGNGTAGGDFVFDFVLGAVATTTTSASSMSASATASTTASATTTALPAGSVSVGTGTSTLQGSVWAHDVRSTTLTRDSTEVGLSGQTIEVRDASKALIARLSTGLDLNGNGQISSDEAGLFRISNLGAGTYTVTQVPSDSWVQAVSSAPQSDQMITVAAGTSGDSKLALVENSGGTAKTTTTWTMGGFRARDVAFKDADEVYAVGTTADGKIKLVHALLEGTAKVTDVALPPNGFKSTLVGLDLVGDQYLLVAAADGSLLRYNLAGRNWMELGKINDGGAAATTVYPVGDIAVASPDLAYAVVTTLAPSTIDFPRADSKQYLLQFDPRTLVPASMRELSTQSPLVGLDLGSSGSLAGLDTQGRLYNINTATGAAAAVTITGQTPANIGGLSILKGGQQGKSSSAPVMVSTADGKTVDIGFGNVATAETLPDGDDTIDGGCGPEGDILNGDDGSLPDEVVSVGGNDSIRGRDGNDILIGGLQGDTLLGDAGNDSLVGGSSASNRMDGGAGKDTLTGGSAADFLFGGDEDDSLSGGAGNDWIHGQAGHDNLQGQDGNDLLVGGAGNDTVAGGNGDDTLVVVNKALSGADYAATPEASGGGNYSGDGGNDKLVAVMEGFAGSANMTLSNADLRILTLAAETINSVESALLVGSDSADTLNATTFTGNSALYGKGGDDSLSSGGGSDVLAGGAGKNTVAGAAMNDLYIVDSNSTGDFINEGPGGGNDTVDASAVSSAISAEISSTGTTAGSGGPGFEFSSNVERLVLGTGNDTVNLAAGLASTMTVVGGAGSDTLSYSNWPATPGVSVNLGTGAVTGLGAALEFDNAVGGKGNDTLIGSLGNNTLDGGEGNDSLYGEAGQDTLSGGAGSNRLEGGADDDFYQFVKTLLNEIVSEGPSSGSDTLNFSGIAATEITYTLDTTDILSVAIGSSASSVQAQSKAALEKVIGGAGQDRFVFSKAGGTAALLDGGASSGLPSDGNLLDYSAYVSPVVVQLPTKPDLPGTATNTGGIKNISRVIGGSAGDALTAGSSAAYLEGGIGADRLVGADGNDSLFGGIGSDTLVGGAGLDSAIYSGARSDYTVSWDSTTKRFSVASATEGTDTVSQVETFVFNGESYSAAALAPGWTSKLSVSASTWNGRAMKAVSLASGAETDTSGAALFEPPSSPLSLSPKLVVDANARSKIDLTDAIQILKSIVGLTTLNPYQTIAADFNSNNAVDLQDAIGVLKQIVGLPAPEPAWVFVDKKSSAPKMNELLSLGETDVELVGILKGDVDGSWGA
jgi:Ca2+-binding RTX toxin-like protein